MTKNVFVTNLKEVRGIKVICKKCNAYFMAPIGAGVPPGMCVMCKQEFFTNYLTNALDAIKDLVLYCKEAGFEVVIETEDE
jgi:hypothetical protein